jgi:uncharacterized protein
MATFTKDSIIATSSETEKKATTISKCDRCFQSKCCQYITQAIVTPRSIKDFDSLIWQVSHKNIHLYKDTNGWFLTCFGQCEHLTASGLCGIYEKRPFVCREYSDAHCEFDQPEDAHCDLYFTSYQQLDDYCRNRFKTWDARFDKLK